VHYAQTLFGGGKMGEGEESLGGSEEERAEAEKFNRLVSEGKLTPAEASHVEKDKTPEEVEAEREAMEKVRDLFERGIIFHSSKPDHMIINLNQGIISDRLRSKLSKRTEIVTPPQKSIMEKRQVEDVVSVYDPWFYADIANEWERSRQMTVPKIVVMGRVSEEDIRKQFGHNSISHIHDHKAFDFQQGYLSWGPGPIYHGSFTFREGDIDENLTRTIKGNIPDYRQHKRIPGGYVTAIIDAKGIAYRERNYVFCRLEKGRLKASLIDTGGLTAPESTVEYRIPPKKILGIATEEEEPLERSVGFRMQKETHSSLWV
jgi:hypothetical protein